MGFEDIFYKNEEQYAKKNIAMFKKVIDEFYEETGINKISMNAYFNIMGIASDDYIKQVNGLRLLVLSNTSYLKYKDIFYNILEENGYNMAYEALIFMSKLSDVRDHDVRDEDIELAKKSPIINRVYYKNRKLYFDIKEYGEFIITPLASYLRSNKEAYDLIYLHELEEYCHQISWRLMNYLDKVNLITSLIPNYFVGTYYHTYLQDENKVIEAAHSMVMEKEDFDKIFLPEEIINLNKEAAIKEYNNILNHYHGEFAEPIAVALSRQI